MVLVVLWGFYCSCFQFIIPLYKLHVTVTESNYSTTAREQECISVGCVPSARYPTGSPWQRPSQTETPLTEIRPDRDSLDRDPSPRHRYPAGHKTPWQRPPLDTDPPFVVNRITDRCKTLPSHNFVCGRLIYLESSECTSWLCLLVKNVVLYLECSSHGKNGECEQNRQRIQKWSLNRQTPNSSGWKLYNLLHFWPRVYSVCCLSVWDIAVFYWRQEAVTWNMLPHVVWMCKRN